VAIDAYKEILPKDDIYDMMEQRPLNGAQKADIRVEIEYFPHKVSNHNTAWLLMPKLCAKYIKPCENFEFTYRTDEDEAKTLLSDAPGSLRGIALRGLENLRKNLQSRSAFINMSASLRDDLTVLQNVIAETLDNAMNQIKYGSVLMTKDNFEISGELIIEDDHIKGYLEPQFDVDIRFGIANLNANERISVYADYYPDTEGLEVSYTLFKADVPDCDFMAFKLADSERAAILEKLREAGLDECVAEMETEETSGLQMT
jgi:hypothetical protein